jgi:excisionase family DNA binding protein
MSHDQTAESEFLWEGLLTVEEVADLLGITSRKVLALPIKQFRLGARTIRFRLQDVTSYLGIDNPNL